MGIICEVCVCVCASVVEKRLPRHMDAGEAETDTKTIFIEYTLSVRSTSEPLYNTAT